MTDGMPGKRGCEAAAPDLTGGQAQTVTGQQGAPGDDPAASAGGLQSAPSTLERRYRLLLRLLPRSYRAAREDEMVGTFLTAMHDADPEDFDLTLKHGRPSGVEIRSVVALAARSRWGATVAPERFAVRRTGLQSALLMALTVLWALAAADVCWWAWSLAHPTVYAGTGFDPWSALFGHPVGSWAWIQHWSIVAWLPALPLTVLGGRTGMRWAAACAVLPLLVDTAHAIRAVTNTSPFWPAYLAPALIDAVVIGGLLAMSAARSDRATRRPLRYLVAACAAGSALAVPAVFYILGSMGPWSGPAMFLFTDASALWCWVAVIAALRVLARGLRHAAVPTASLVALSVFAGAATVGRFLSVASTLPGLDPGLGSAWTVAVVTQLVLGAAICVISGAASSRRLHRLPFRPYPA